MSRITWTQNPRYETGIDRGVLYPIGGPGVAWNGIISVNETSVGAERSEQYYDGVKFRDDVSTRIYQATLKAFSYPIEFETCMGLQALVPGFLLTAQLKSRFCLSYRTQIGTQGYKIHIIYSATASTSNRSNATLSGSKTDPSEFEWKIDAVPPESTLYKPTAHFVIDSTKTTPSSLALLEAMMYGTDNAPPTLPTPSDLINFLKN